MKRLLIVAHAPSENTRALRDAVERGARSETGIDVAVVAPLQSGPDDVLAAQAVILGTTENLGYMSGALKDFFDRSYNPLLENSPAEIFDPGFMESLAGYSVLEVPSKYYWEGPAKEHLNRLLYVDVKMTLTAQGCGMGVHIAAEAQDKILGLPGVEEADVQVVWEPPWNPKMISPEGRQALGMD